MKWTAEAEDAIKEIPFFARKRARIRVEKEAEGKGKSLITIGRFLRRSRFIHRQDCLSFYRRRSSKGGERFAEIFTEQAFEETSACICRN